MYTANFARLAALVVPVLLSGCVTTEAQQDGSTRVRVSVADALGLKKVAAPDSTAPAPNKPATQSAPAATPLAPGLASTTLNRLFTKHPYDGTVKSNFPRVAVTIVDWSRSDCWTARAKIWWSASKSENVSPFSVCFANQSLGFALNNAANIHIFFEQTAMEHTGNVRSEGPKAPMIAVPDHPANVNSQSTFVPFVQQMIAETGWKGGAFTNFWIVGYNQQASAAPVASAPAAMALPVGKNTKQLAVIEQGLLCKTPKTLESSMRVLAIPTDGSQVAAPSGLTVLGKPVTNVSFALESGEAIHRAYFAPDVTLEQIAKSAALKLDKNKRLMRIIKIDKNLVGILSAEKDGGSVVLTCSIDYEQNQ